MWRTDANSIRETMIFPLALVTLEAVRVRKRKNAVSFLRRWQNGIWQMHSSRPDPGDASFGTYHKPRLSLSPSDLLLSESHRANWTYCFTFVNEILKIPLEQACEFLLTCTNSCRFLCLLSSTWKYAGSFVFSSYTDLSMDYEILFLKFLLIFIDNIWNFNLSNHI